MQGYADESLGPKGYYSRTLTEAERNYDKTESEFLAIMWAVLLLRLYLYGTHFEIRTDHESLRWILHLDTPSERVARWKLGLQEFDFEVFYRPGMEQLAPDGLYRLDTNGDDDTDIDDEIPVIDFAKVETKTIDTFHDDYPASQQATPYPDLKQADDPISRETFLREQAWDENRQNYVPFALKAYSNIT